MYSTVSVPVAIEDGLANLKANFWTYILIIIVLGILDSLGTGPAFRQGLGNTGFEFGTPGSGGFLSVVVAIFIKPVFDFSAKMIFLGGVRGEPTDLKDIARGFNSKAKFIDIILTNILIMLMLIAGFVCLVIPGIFIACRVVLAPYLVMDKGLAPKAAISASWELTRDFWFQALVLGLVSGLMFVVGMVLLLVGMIPAFAWIKSMFACFYQQVLDVHSEEFLLSLDISP